MEDRIDFTRLFLEWPAQIAIVGFAIAFFVVLAWRIGSPSDRDTKETLRHRFRVIMLVGIVVLALVGCALGAAGYAGRAETRRGDQEETKRQEAEQKRAVAEKDSQTAIAARDRALKALVASHVRVAAKPIDNTWQQMSLDSETRWAGFRVEGGDSPSLDEMLASFGVTDPTARQKLKADTLSNVTVRKFETTDMARAQGFIVVDEEPAQTANQQGRIQLGIRLDADL